MRNSSVERIQPKQKTARRRSLAIGKLKRPQDIFRRQKLPRGLRVKIACMHSPAPVGICKDKTAKNFLSVPQQHQSLLNLDWWRGFRRKISDALQNSELFFSQRFWPSFIQLPTIRLRVARSSQIRRQDPSDPVRDGHAKAVREGLAIRQTKTARRRSGHWGEGRPVLAAPARRAGLR